VSDSLAMRCLDAWIPAGKQLGAVTTISENRKRDFYFYEDGGSYYVEIHEVVGGTVNRPREMLFLEPEELQKIAEVVQKFPPKTPTPGVKK